MTYPKTLTEFQKDRLRQVLPQIEGLRPGESSRISAKTTQGASLLKYLLYTWLSPDHSGRKDEFAIKTISSKEFLIRRSPDCSCTVEKIGGEHPRLKDFVHIQDEDELISALNEAELNSKDIIQIHKEWTEIHHG